MRVTTCLWVLAFVFAALAAPPMEAAAKQSKRYGIEGFILGYDEEKQTVRVKVIETKVPGRFATGNPVGGKAPSDIKRGQEYDFAIEPEGSILRRTVIRAETGAGLDLTGTQEGFTKAFAKVPLDRLTLMSLEDNSPDAVKRGAPKYKIMLVQIQMTLEELIRRWEKISVEE
jgi:hypothetical protein